MNTRAGALTLLCLFVAPLMSCVVAPTLRPDGELVQKYSSDPTLTNAVKVAESLRDAYTKEVEDQIVTERVTALALITAAAVAADMAIRQVGENDVLALTLGAGAVYTGVNFIVSKPQQYIYAAGANAVQCALDAMHPLRVAYTRRDDLEGLMRETDLDVRNLESRLLSFRDINVEEAQRGRAVVEEANGVLPVAREALNVLDNAGGELYSSIGRVQSEVTRAIANNSPNLQSLMQQLGTALPALGAQLTGVPLPATKDAKPPKKSSADPVLIALTKLVEADLVDLQLIISAVQAKPSVERLKTCSVDLQQSGLTMKVTPSGAVTMAAGTAATFSITGGVLPYQQASWLGPTPAADKVELTTESGAGIVTLKTKADAAVGTYVLLLRDSAQGREVVNVTVTATTGKAANPSQVEKVAAKCVPVPRIRKVQQALFDKGIKNVKVGTETKPVAVDGCPGPITDEAMRTFMNLRENGGPLPEGSIPIASDELLKDVANLLDIPEDQ